VEGIENVPKEGHVIFYSNHGGWIAADGPLLYSIFLKTLEENVTAFANPFLFKIPGLKWVLEGMNAFPVDKIDDIELLKKHSRLYFVAPEGADGTTKPFTESYQLRPFRTGFIKLGLRLRAKVMPVTIIGNEELFPVMMRLEKAKKFVGTPWPIPFSIFPIPISKIDCKIYPAIDFGKYDADLAEDPRFCNQMAERLKRDLQKRLDEHAKRQPLFLVNKLVRRFFNREKEPGVIKTYTTKKSPNGNKNSL
jgi:1-acyl-sn-glycerol-3-phosphate acyltransferase